MNNPIGHLLIRLKHLVADPFHEESPDLGSNHLRADLKNLADCNFPVSTGSLMYAAPS